MATAKEYLERAIELADLCLAKMKEGKMNAARLQIFTPQDLRAWLEALGLAYEAAQELELLRREEGESDEKWVAKLLHKEMEERFGGDNVMLA